MKPKTVSEVRQIARRNLTDNARLYYESGADGEQTLSENCRAYDRLRLWRSLPLHEIEVDLSTDLLGTKIKVPICISPTAMHRMAHDDGEIATAQAAKEFGTCMCVSILSTTTYEDIATRVPNGHRWMQLSIYNDREMTRDIIKAAEATGCTAVVLTVDAPVLGQRIADEKYKMKLPDHLALKIFEGKIPNKLSNESGSALAAFINENKEQDLQWKIIDWIRTTTHMPVLVKGIVTFEDAELCLKYKVDGIVVSNHGARQLDGGPATIEALPEVVRAVQGKIPVFIDGGIRRGSDVFKALALGAQAVFIGRPVLYGLAHNGTEGVKDVLGILSNELKRTMEISGCKNIKEIDSSMVVHESSLGLYTSSLTESSNWKPTTDIIKCIPDVKESARLKSASVIIPNLFSDDIFILQKFRIRPRMLRGIRKIDVRSLFLGLESSFPVIIGIDDAIPFVDHDSICKVLKEFRVLSIETSPAVKHDGYSSANILEVKNSQLSADLLSQAAKFGTNGIIVVNDGTVLKHTLIGNSKVPVLLKGISTKHDALSCIKMNIQGIIVVESDTMPAVEVLSEVVDALKGKLPVFYEGSVTKGSDLFKILGLGAKAVIIKNAVVWGAMHQRAEGVKLVLKILKDELVRTMYLAGAGTVDGITPSMVVRESFYWNVGKSVSRL